MRHSRRKKTCGTVHIHIALSGPSTINTSKIHDAHQPRKCHSLYPWIVKFQEGKLLLQRIIYRSAGGENVFSRHIKQSFRIPGHVICRLRRFVCEVLGYCQQILLCHRLGGNPGLILKGIRPKMNPPQKTGSGVKRQRGASCAQHRAVSPVSPVSCRSNNGNSASDDISGA